MTGRCSKAMSGIGSREAGLFVFMFAAVPGFDRGCVASRRDSPASPVMKATLKACSAASRDQASPDGG